MSPSSHGEQRLITALTLACCLGAVSMSVSGLLKVADMAGLPHFDAGGKTWPWGALGLICCLDAAAFATGMMRRARRMWQATALMAASVLVSMAAQAIAEFVEHGMSPKTLFVAAIHTLGAAFAWGISETLLLFLRGEPTQGKTSNSARGAATSKGDKSGPTTRQARAGVSPPPPAPPVSGMPAEGTPPAGRSGERRASPAAPQVSGLRLVPAPLSEADTELARQMSDWLDAHRVDLSRGAVQRAHTELFESKPGNSKADRIMKLVRQYQGAPTAAAQES